MTGRVCPSCRKHRGLNTFSVAKPGQGWRASDGSYRYSYCKWCNRQRVKDYYKDPDHREARIEYMRAYHAAHKDDPDYIAQRRAYYMSERGQELAHQRKERWEQRIRSNPHLLAEVLERRRLWAYEARRRAGMREIGGRAGKATVAAEHDLRLPREPFVEWLDQKEDEYGGLDLLAQVTGIAARTIRRIQSGEEQTRVSIDTVDTALTREGSTGLWEVYPALYEEVAA